MTMIVVTHELEFARRISTKVMLMDEGVIAESAGAEKFFNSPESERTKQFLEKINS
jgi:ABC-type polar amino acid transport system ATPase subunit